MKQENYPKLGGDLTYACQRLAEGANAIGVVIALYRGVNKEIETGITFASELKFKSEEFRKLANTILYGAYSEITSKADKACIMLAEVTSAECVILFVIKKDGAVSVTVSQPKPDKFIADIALQIANSFDQMN